jgi:hypothetical protein
MVIKERQCYFSSHSGIIAYIKANGQYFCVNEFSERVFINISKKSEGVSTSIIFPLNHQQGTHELGVNLNATTYLSKGLKNSTRLTEISKYLLKKKTQWTFLKFKYHGKGYKIKKYNQLHKVTLRFGKSHWTKILFDHNHIIIRRTKKNSYCIITTSLQFLKS